MADEKKTVELPEEELEQVSGGGGGFVPESGIVFSNYPKVETNRFYASVSDCSAGSVDTVYVYDYCYEVLGRQERITIDGSVWRASTLESSGHPVGADFMSIYPYVLNIIPQWK